MFTGIDQEVCHTAWSMVLPSIERCADEGITNKLAGCMVVAELRLDNGQPEFIFRQTINSLDEDRKYYEIATAKALVSLRTGMPSAMVQQQYPYLYRDGDTKWGGSTVLPGGLVVAFSGVQAVFDEMIAEWMASAIRGLCRWEMTKPDGVMASESSFIGD